MDLSHGPFRVYAVYLARLGSELCSSSLKVGLSLNSSPDQIDPLPVSGKCNRHCHKVFALLTAR
jgi:hypothetical protein